MTYHRKVPRRSFISPALPVATIRSLHWYALRVAPRKEFVAQMLLADRAILTYCPSDRRWRKTNKFTKRKELLSYALLPSYVFAGFEKRTPPWLDVFAVPTVQSVVGFEGAPMELPIEAVERLMGKFKNGIQRPIEERFMRTHHEFKAGQSVKVANGGPFDGWTVPVHEVKGAEATIFLDLFGSRREIVIGTEFLEAA